MFTVCEFMCTSDLPFDIERARYWCDRGAELFPHDPAIFRLKEKLLTLGGSPNSQAFESLINCKYEKICFENDCFLLSK